MVNKQSAMETKLQLCRYFLPGTGARLAAVRAGQVYDLTASHQPGLATLHAWMQFVLREGLARAIELLHSTVSGAQPAARWADLLVAPDANRPHLLAPLDEQEVWAAGVTYRRSAEAREEEAHNIGVYDKVYSAERPEIFMKATPQRVVGPHAPVRIRGDSFWNVPEPELTVVFAPDMQVVGYTVGNDMSSRDIEGANPLYLPQAKIYTGSCALGPAITLLPDLDLQPGATIGLRIERAGAAVFVGETSTREMKRTVAELGGYLGRYNAFPAGVFLMTGTGLVPPDDFTLQPGDDVQITISGIGMLRNLVLGG